MRLDYSFFGRDTVVVAEDLVGKILVYNSRYGVIKGIINETEAYSQDEESCHCFGGKTKGNEVMFKSGGHLYVYFIYGNHFCINIVTEKEHRGCAVLIRSVIPLDDMSYEIMVRNRRKDKNLCDGPGKLCIAYGFNREHNGVNLCDESSDLYVEDLGLKPKKIEKTKRIGISKAVDLEWRFVAKEFVSS